MLLKEGTIIELLEGFEDNKLFINLAGTGKKERLLTVKQIKEICKNDPIIYKLVERKFNYGKVKKVSIRVDGFGVYNEV